jgi:hypothetical protein
VRLIILTFLGMIPGSIKTVLYKNKLTAKLEKIPKNNEKVE